MPPASSGAQVPTTPYPEMERPLLNYTKARRHAVAVAVAASGMLAIAPHATADPGAGSGADNRATNPGKNAKACADVNAAGNFLDSGDVRFTGGAVGKDRYLTVQSVAEGLTVTAVVIKGGDGYNLYVPGERGMATEPPWEKLRAPRNNGGNIPQISHRFFCGTSTPVTAEQRGDGGSSAAPASPSTGATTSVGAAPSTMRSSTGVGTSTSAGHDGQRTTSAATSTDAAAASTARSDLADTGFDGGWLIWLGSALALTGSVCLVLLRGRGARHR